jgi:hypothetical protein
MVRRTTSCGQCEFESESEVRAAVAAARNSCSTLDAAEASDEWRALRPFVARWVSNRFARPVTSDPAWSDHVTVIYLRRPHLLPALPPADPSVDAAQ